MVPSDVVCTELRSLPGNDACSDCSQTGPLGTAVFPHGILVCTRCADIHRSLDYSVSRVKSLTDSHWTTEEFQKMKKYGNAYAARKYEKFVPAYYRRPSANSPFAVVEQWIRGKYERNEFSANRKDCEERYEVTRREDVLMKRGRTDSSYRARLFIIDSSENTLRYYNQAKMETPKGTYRLDSLNVAFVPDKCQHPNAVQLTYSLQQEQIDGRRNIFLYAESTEQLISWYTTIRAIKYKRMTKLLSHIGSKEICRLLSHDFTKEGWLKKSGSKSWNAHRLRWMTLDQNKLYYYESPLDANPKGSGVITIGRKEQGYSVIRGISPGDTNPGEFCFTIETPDRKFVMSAETSTELEEWLIVLQALL